MKRFLCVVIATVSGFLGAVTFGSNDGAVKKYLVTEYFGIFNDGTSDGFHECISKNPPYKMWDITFIAFVHGYYKDNIFVVDYENARGNGSLPNPGDTDKDRIQELIKVTKAVNPNMKFIISLGWKGSWAEGPSDFGDGAKNPKEYAQSICKIIKENNLDGFDIDYEGKSVVTQDVFKTLIKEIRTQMNALSKEMKKTLYLTVTPCTKTGLDVTTINKYIDYVQMQSYDYSGDAACNPSTIINLSDSKTGAKINPSKILFGRDIENDDTLKSTRYFSEEGGKNVVEYINENNLGGLMGWRINSGKEMNNGFQEVELLGNALNR